MFGSTTGLANALLLSAVIAFCWSAASTGSTEATSASGYAGGGAETCLLCHSDPHSRAILATAHFTSGDPRSPGAQQACQSCHGPARAHVADPMAVKPILFGPKSATPVDEQNIVCLNCHETGERIDWHVSSHASASLACSTCHAVHDPHQAALDRETQAGVCFACHPDKRQALRRRSHHPVEEGLVSCPDCHNPHGGVGQLRSDTVNDTCFLCHAEKRGPFLWEHPPVADDCTNCHDPHGSVHPNLLHQRPPFLCQQCHSNAYHPGTLRSGTGLPTAMPDNKLLGSGCVNCHSQVHGSNHPSGDLLSR